MPRSDLVAGATIRRPFAALPEVSCAAVRVAVTVLGAGMVVVPIFAEDATCRGNRPRPMPQSLYLRCSEANTAYNPCCGVHGRSWQAAAEPSVVPYRFQWEPRRTGQVSFARFFGSAAYWALWISPAIAFAMLTGQAESRTGDR